MVTGPLFDVGADLERALSGFSNAGSRQLLALPWCAQLAARILAHPTIRPALPLDAVAVQCTYFEKTRGQNWLVPLHQDLGIPVMERVDHPAWSGWSMKEGGLFVQPPLEVLQQLLAVRIHLDACGLDDGPLRVVSGSHRIGRLSSRDALLERDRQGETVCTVERGAALLMKPLILHASSKASGHSRRRVLHFLFGAAVLPHGLRWR